MKATNFIFLFLSFISEIYATDLQPITEEELPIVTLMSPLENKREVKLKLINSLQDIDFDKLPSLEKEEFKNIKVFATSAPLILSGINSLNVEDHRKFISNWKNHKLNPAIAQGSFMLCALAIPLIPTKNAHGIIMLNGSDGINKAAYKQALSLANRGYGILLIETHWGTSYDTSENQFTLPLEDTILKAFRGADLLRTHPMFNQKIGIIGRSRGGTVALMCADPFYQQNIAPDNPFSAFIMYYCQPMRIPSSETNTLKGNFLFIHGKADNWTPFLNVKMLVDNLDKTGKFKKMV